MYNSIKIYPNIANRMHNYIQLENEGLFVESALPLLR